MRLTSESRQEERRGGPGSHDPLRLPDDPCDAKRFLLEALVENAAGTQEDLAADLGISYATLHAWKTGRREVPDSAMEGMARMALRRSRVLLDAGSRLLRLLESEAASGTGSVEELRLQSAETRARARAIRAYTREVTDRARSEVARIRETATEVERGRSGRG